MDVCDKETRAEEYIISYTIVFAFIVNFTSGITTKRFFMLSRLIEFMQMTAYMIYFETWFPYLDRTLKSIIYSAHLSFLSRNTSPVEIYNGYCRSNCQDLD
jgi:hypothetical protein